MKPAPFLAETYAIGTQGFSGSFIVRPRHWINRVGQRPSWALSDSEAIAGTRLKRASVKSVLDVRDILWYLKYLTHLGFRANK
jgi:hypothetical protein